jgi:hypothetical protein
VQMLTVMAYARAKPYSRSTTFRRVLMERMTREGMIIASPTSLSPLSTPNSCSNQRSAKTQPKAYLFVLGMIDAVSWFKSLKPLCSLINTNKLCVDVTDTYFLFFGAVAYLNKSSLHFSQKPRSGSARGRLMRMHTAVRLNEVIRAHSSNASLVIINFPAPPMHLSASENCILVSCVYLLVIQYKVLIVLL